MMTVAVAVAENNNNNNTRVVEWCDLPRDVLQIIFKKLDNFEDLIKGVSLCCTSWYHASKLPSSWLEEEEGRLNLNMLRLSFLCYKYSTTWSFDIYFKIDIINSIVARSHGALTSIKFPLSYFTVNLLHHLAIRCPKLKYLHLEVERECSCKRDFMEKTLDRLCNVITKLKQLDGMAITCTTITSSSMVKILQQISKFCPNFNKLKILDQLSESLAYNISKTLPNLKVLDLSNTTTRPAAVLTILNNCNELQSLDITSCQIPISNNSKIACIAHLRLKEFNYDDQCKNPNFDASFNCAARGAVSLSAFILERAVSVPTYISEEFNSVHQLYSLLKTKPWEEGFNSVHQPYSLLKPKPWEEGFNSVHQLYSLNKPHPWEEICCPRRKYEEYAWTYNL